MNSEIPEVVDFFSRFDFCVATMSTGAIVFGTEIDLADLETTDLDQFECSFSDFLKSLDPSYIARFCYRSSISHDIKEDNSRYHAVQNLGYVKNVLYLLIEVHPSPISQAIDIIKKKFKKSHSFDQFISNIFTSIQMDFLKEFGLSRHTLPFKAFQSLLPKSLGYIQRLPYGIDLGEHIVGCVRLTKQTVYPVDLLTLATIKDQFQLPYGITVTVMNSSAQASETTIRKHVQQAEGMGNDSISASKYSKAQDSLEKIALDGGRILRVEFVVTFARKSESEIRDMAKQVCGILKIIGEPYFETIGAEPTWLATLPGNLQHVPFLETDEAVTCYIPILSRGDVASKQVKTKRSLVLHRRDESLGYMDLFNPQYDSYSVNIFGSSGSGKSVLANMLTRAVLNDPFTTMIKLDVGGSHSKETRALNGKEYLLSIDQPTGINPFSYLKKADHTPEMVQILSAFIETLTKEEGEAFFSKEMKADIELALNAYSVSRPNKPSLDEFLHRFSGQIPRAKLLGRWTGGGVYGNAFKEIPKNEDNRYCQLHYYNFAKISQALDGDFAQGGLAAVMSAFNFEMLFERRNRRFVFLADEVPVFIKRAFDFFSLSIANIRKNGDAFITIAQRSDHVVVDGNTSILDNSPSKFIFSVDGDRDLFSKRLNIPLFEVQKIEELRRKQGSFSEVYHLDQFGSRVYRIQLSPEEYWSYTSKKEDRDKYDLIKQAIPNLSEKEIIKCLSYSE